MEMEIETASSASANGEPTPPPPAGSANQPGAGQPAESQELSGEQKRVILFIGIGLVVLIAATIGSVVFLMNTSEGEVARIRDIFIIFLAVQSLFMGLALVILIVQIARLINLLQNEVKPILDSTNETISNLRGTTAFLSDNLAEPVIKLNEVLAGLNQLFLAIGFTKRTLKKKPPKGV